MPRRPRGKRGPNSLTACLTTKRSVGIRKLAHSFYCGRKEQRGVVTCADVSILMLFALVLTDSAAAPKENKCAQKVIPRCVSTCVCVCACERNPEG